MNPNSLNSQPSTLNLVLKRIRKTRWGIDGHLFINGEPVADTVEHPTFCLKAGTYPITLNRLLLRRGNGPFLNTDGSFCVGEHLCAGCVLRTSETFLPLYNRIQKALRRGHSVNLTILNDASVL